MNLIPMICALIGCISMVVLVCLVNSDKLILLFNIIGISFLIGLSVVTINFANSFNAFSVLILISILPLFLTCFKFDIFKEKENENEEENLKKDKKNKTLTEIIKGLGFLLSSICLSVAVLYIGLETYLIALLGLSIGVFLTFLTIILKKIYKNEQKNEFFIQFLTIFLHFLSSGLFLSVGISALMYSLVLKNILFAIGSMLIGINIILNNYLNSKFITPLLYAGVILIISSLIV